MASLSPTVVVVVVVAVAAPDLALAAIFPTIKPALCYNKVTLEVTTPLQLSPPPIASPPPQTLLVAAAPAPAWSPLVQRSAPYPVLT
uniref:Putative secreted protein n=1 Tax=Anopheles darlingi TaxID=43151 RepID=A0A2M4DC06_ANODA